MPDLDTTSKRRSSVQVLASYNLAPPLPDGTLDAGDRQHIAWTYALAAAAAPSATETRVLRVYQGLIVESFAPAQPLVSIGGRHRPGRR